MAFDSLYRQLRQEVRDLKTSNERRDSKSERAEIGGAVEAFTLADAPTGDGLGDTVSYTSLAWIVDGRRPGLGAGTGTGVLAFFEASSATWISVFDQSAVVI